MIMIMHYYHCQVIIILFQNITKYGDGKRQIEFNIGNNNIKNKTN